MEPRHLDPIRIRAALVRLTAVALVILPFVLAACGPDGGGGDAPAY